MSSSFLKDVFRLMHFFAGVWPQLHDRLMPYLEQCLSYTQVLKNAGSKLREFATRRAAEFT